MEQTIAANAFASTGPHSFAAIPLFLPPETGANGSVSLRNHYPRDGDRDPASQTAPARSLLPAQYVESSFNTERLAEHPHDSIDGFLSDLFLAVTLGLSSKRYGSSPAVEVAAKATRIRSSTSCSTRV